MYGRSTLWNYWKGRKEGLVAAYSASSTSLEHRLVQTASGCAPSVESLTIFDVKQTECGTLLGWVTVQPSE